MSFTFPLLVPVADIKAIVTGKDCPHMKEKSALKQNKVTALFFCLEIMPKAMEIRRLGANKKSNWSSKLATLHCLVSKNKNYYVAFFHMIAACCELLGQLVCRALMLL